MVIVMVALVMQLRQLVADNEASGVGGGDGVMGVAEVQRWLTIKAELQIGSSGSLAVTSA